MPCSHLHKTSALTHAYRKRKWGRERQRGLECGKQWNDLTIRVTHFVCACVTITILHLFVRVRARPPAHICAFVLDVIFLTTKRIPIFISRKIQSIVTLLLISVVALSFALSFSYSFILATACRCFCR